MITTFAPINIALVKYWGKRDPILNLPVTDSLSLSAKKTGTTTTIGFAQNKAHQVCVNQTPLTKESEFYSRLTEFLARVAPYQYFHLDIKSDIPIAAGLASSASGYASLVLALNELLKWNYSLKELSVLARQGSGSACRSLWPGLVHWKSGHRLDGRDSHGEPLPPWPELSIGVILLNAEPKKTSSRDGMLHCQETSPLYRQWPGLVMDDIDDALSAIEAHDFERLGEVTEHSSEAMHACMRASTPPLDYSLPETFELLREVKSLRAQGLPVYATQDAGPNVKLLYLANDGDRLKAYFGQKHTFREL
jgi:diphosphomevalonate decarboxylase